MAGVGDQEGNRTALVADPWAKDFRGGRPGVGGGGGRVGRNIVGCVSRWEKFTLRARKVNLIKCVQQVFGKGDLMLMFCPGFRTARRDAAHAGETALLAKRAAGVLLSDCLSSACPLTPAWSRVALRGGESQATHLNCVWYGCPSRRGTPSQTHQALAQPATSVARFQWF